MNIAIITRKILPTKCGITDHSLMLAKSFLNLGYRTTIIAGKGEQGENRKIISLNIKNAINEALFFLTII